jgi:O-antigen chain-terminating methyltransferase
MKTNSESYKEHLENKYLPGRDKYLQWFFYPKILKLFKSGKIVDLGCGTGEFLQFLKLKKREAVGIDNNPYLVEKCSAMGFDIKLDDVTKLEHLDANMMNAMCDNVLEHIDLNQIDHFFGAIKSKMAEGSTLVIVVPDKKGFKHDPTPVTFVDKYLISKMCSKHGLCLGKNFAHPLNIPFVGNFFYLNMQVFAVAV